MSINELENRIIFCLYTILPLPKTRFSILLNFGNIYLKTKVSENNENFIENQFLEFLPK